MVMTASVVKMFKTWIDTYIKPYIAIGRVILAIAMGLLIAVMWVNYSNKMDELKELRDFKTATEAKEEVIKALEESFKLALDERAEQRASNANYQAKARGITQEVAKNDKATADFLATPIPDRLRNADREARSGRLDTAPKSDR